MNLVRCSPHSRPQCLHLQGGTERYVRAAVRGSGTWVTRVLSPVSNLNSLMWTIELQILV